MREAKDVVVSRIVEEAQGEGSLLSELERKMFYVSVPEMSQAEAEFCAGFDRESDQDRPEQKIAGVIKKAEFTEQFGEPLHRIERPKLKSGIVSSLQTARFLIINIAGEP